MRFLSAAVLSIAVLSGCSGESIEKQAKKLGTREFTAQAWRGGTQEERGQMIASFLGKHVVTELTGKQVKDLLGPSTGYYDYDEYPAYLVGPGTVRTEYGSSYLWVFMTDKNSGKVREVILVPPVQDK
ncbi:hypothetical protein [Massilia aerilata]|uniref:Outer membrane protein assembly factor BamE n=1 Tax=Massilia aerilata TaxID=453817 RepID=A0ABW0RWV9_9BURK